MVLYSRDINQMYSIKKKKKCLLYKQQSNKLTRRMKVAKQVSKKYEYREKNI